MPGAASGQTAGPVPERSLQPGRLWSSTQWLYSYNMGPCLSWLGGHCGGALCSHRLCRLLLWMASSDPVSLHGVLVPSHVFSHVCVSGDGGISFIKCTTSISLF